MPTENNDEVIDDLDNTVESEQNGDEETWDDDFDVIWEEESNEDWEESEDLELPPVTEPGMTWQTMTVDLGGSVYGSLKTNNSMNRYQKDGKFMLYEDLSALLPEEEVTLVVDYGYFKKNDPRLVIDYITGKWILNDKRFYNPIMSIYTSIDENGELGDKEYTVILPGHPAYPHSFDEIIRVVHAEDTYNITVLANAGLLNNDVFKKFYTECLNDGIFYKNGLQISKKKLSQPLGTKIMGRKVKNNKSFLNMVKDSKKPMTYINTFGKKYSFGLEIETSSGYIPSYLDKFLYYSAVHDGSLRHEDGNTYGLEYVTDVLKGDLGLQQAKLLCNVLEKRCLIDRKCGVHVHLGDVNFSRENIVLMYYIYRLVENEIFQMLPKSRRNNEYCRRLDSKINIDLELIKSDYKMSIEKYYQDIIRFLSKKDFTSKYINKKTDHPAGFKCGYDHSTARYCWVNFIPSVFDTRKNGIYTIEFRPMSASTSYVKIKNWLMICMALVSVVENHKQAILSGEIKSLSDILSVVYPKNCRHLIEYVELRKSKFSDKPSDIDQEAHDYIEKDTDHSLSFKNL